MMMRKSDNLTKNKKIKGGLYMKTYVSPVVKTMFYDKQDVITSSTTVLGTDNGVFWPGFTSGGEDYE